MPFFETLFAFTLPFSLSFCVMPATKRKMGAFAKRFVKKRAAAKPATGTKRKMATPGAPRKRRAVPKRKPTRYHAGFNPQFNNNIVYPHSIAPYVKVHSRVNGTLQTQTSAGMESYVLAFFSDSAIRGIRLVPYGNPAGSFMTQDLIVDALNTATLELTGPLGLAINIRNLTRADAVSGSVRVLVTPCPMTWQLSDSNPDIPSSTFISNLRGIMSSSPSAKTYTAEHFRETKSFSSFPANVVKSMDYQDHHTNVVRDHGDQSVHNNLHITDALKHMISAMIIVQFSESSAPNQYDFSLHDATRCRFNESSVMATQHTVPSAIHPDVHNSAVRSAASSAGTAVQPMNW